MEPKDGAILQSSIGSDLVIDISDIEIEMTDEISCHGKRAVGHVYKPSDTMAVFELNPHVCQFQR